MTRPLFFATFSLVLLGLSAPRALAQLTQNDGDPLVDVVAQGKARINYAVGVVKATGYGAPPTGSQNPAQARLMAVGAARADALRNLAIAVSSIQVTATTQVKNFVTESDVIETKVSALLQNARITSEVIGKDGVASVVMELPLYGKRSIAAAVLPEALNNPLAMPNAPTEPAPVAVREPSAPRPIRPGKASGVSGFKEPVGGARPIKVEPRVPKPNTPRIATLALTPSSENANFTSVIIDCRGLGIQAVMSPKIYDTAGHEIYGTLNVDTDYAIEIGIVGYPRTPNEALASKRAGERPLIVKALRAKDRFKIDVVLSQEDGKRILEANEQDGFLEKCRVILLCDPVR